MHKIVERILLCSIFFAIFLCGCTSLAPNVNSATDLQGRKILAGRFVFYDNDELVKADSHRSEVRFYQQGENKEIKKFSPDEQGYVYVAVTEGLYVICDIFYIPFGGGLQFVLDPMPAIYVNANDTVVNFGTIEIRYYQTTGGRIIYTFGFPSRVQYGIRYIRDWYITKPEIVSRAGFAGPVRDVEIYQLPRRFKRSTIQEVKYLLHIDEIL